jgi:hypothetical protein
MVLTAHGADIVQRLSLMQHAHNLCFRKALTLHRPSSRYAITLTYQLVVL